MHNYSYYMNDGESDIVLENMDDIVDFGGCILTLNYLQVDWNKAICPSMCISVRPQKVFPISVIQFLSMQRLVHQQTQLELDVSWDGKPVDVVTGLSTRA